jgi:hypothetical protein
MVVSKNKIDTMEINCYVFITNNKLTNTQQTDKKWRKE